MFQGQAEIVNLAVGGFGLTNEIRTFYEFGVLFQPSVVVLQFAANDPDDNFFEKVTTVADGRFRFHVDRSDAGWLGWLKDWLSGSILQRSAAYNFVRNHGLWILAGVDHLCRGGGRSGRQGRVLQRIVARLRPRS